MMDERMVSKKKLKRKGKLKPAHCPIEQRSTLKRFRRRRRDTLVPFNIRIKVEGCF